jgi:predicted ATPase/class 3 adenylate cyclase
MQCSQCSFENPLGMEFCGKCGAKLALPCASCGFVNPEGFAFCGKCGSPLTVGTAASVFQPAPKFASPQAYTPKHLAEKILTSKSSLEGERKQVTVLFADMKGSMELLADRDPEEARKLLDPVIEHMMEAVHRFEGTVSNLMGDGIMALFGAPLAHEDHAVRACYAALRMQESVNRYADGVRRTEGVPIQIRVGLNSGEVVVGAIGNDLKMDYTAIGQTVHLASRMEQMATPGSVLMTADALRLAEGYVQVKSLGPVSVKGLTGPLEVFEVIGVGAARSRLQAAAARGLTRFVGRDDETEQLRKALEQARSDHGQVVGVVGEPGLGKSRLFFEFIHSHRTQGWLILESGSVSYGKATPYLPVIDLLKAYFKIQDRDDQREIREKVTGKLLTLDKSLEPTLPAVLALLDVTVEDSQWQSLDPPQRRQRTLDAVKRLLLRESQVQPLVLVFEDLHWIDSETQAVLESLIESLPSARILLLVNYRPEYQHSWGSKTYYSQLRIDPLTLESADELVQALLGEDANLKLLKQLLIERTEGNPFFLEESVWALAETKLLAGERGNYHLEKELVNTEIPATVQAVLAARIDRLRAEEKRLLQSASVIGKDFPFALLQAITELPDERLRQGLAHLQAAEFLYETSLFPDLEYTFKHALTHQVAYQSLLRASRQNCHKRIAQVLEHEFADVVETQPQLLAHHYTEAGLGPQAIHYLQRAGERANERAANTEAISHLSKGLELLKALPDSPEGLQHELSLYTVLGRALKDVRGYGDPEVEQAYARARELCRQVGEAPQLFSTLLGLSIYFVVRAELQTARELGGQLLEIARRAQDPVLLVEAHYVLGVTCFWLGEFAPARQHLEQGIAHYDPRRHQSHIVLFGQNEGVVCLCREALVLWYLGYPDQAVARGTEAFTLVQELSHPASLAYVRYWIAFLYHQRREAQKTLEWTDASMTLSTEQGFAYWPPQGMILQGWVLAEQRRVAEGIIRMREGLAALQVTGTEIVRAYSLGLLANACKHLGQFREGLTLLDAALTAVDKTGGRWSEAELHRLKGELLARQNVSGAQQAEICFGQALAVARRQQAKSLELRAAMGLCRLWQKKGKRQQARDLLSEIYGWFTEGFNSPDLRQARGLLEELS